MEETKNYLIRILDKDSSLDDTIRSIVPPNEKNGACIDSLGG